MPSFADSIFLFVLALLLFGPKKLPVLARELGKWMGEFRRASNEFKMQMEEELRASEQADRQKQIAAMEAAAPVPPPLNEPAEPEHPHLRDNSVEPEAPASEAHAPTSQTDHPERSGEAQLSADVATAASTGDEGHTPAMEASSAADEVRPIPIATSGSLNMMPPATGLPTPRSRGGNGALSSLVESIPEVSTPSSTEPESVAHGD